MLLHGWTLLALAFCLTLASLSLVRGIANLIVARQMLVWAEAGALLLAGIVGWIGALLVHRSAG